MHRTRNIDVFTGIAIVLIGFAILYYTVSRYNLGTIYQMGPGMFPAALGALLAILGAVLAISACFQSGQFAMPRLRLGVSLAVLASIAAFAASLQRAGLIPAIVLLVAIASLAERKFRPLVLAGLCIVLSFVAVVIFRYGLGIYIPLLRWPF